ncbi:hypothetical protein [Streptomyces sp. NPDC002785]|uniref:hypothetical protein n=1 Tax=Streptomyces sp. NPDC002785 TaxID=3154543 RepID=UPI003332176A
MPISMPVSMSIRRLAAASALVLGALTVGTSIGWDVHPTEAAAAAHGPDAGGGRDALRADVIGWD